MWSKNVDYISKNLTHSSIMSPSPTIRGPESSGQLLCVSSSASASTSRRFSFSNSFKRSDQQIVITAVTQKEQGRKKKIGAGSYGYMYECQNGATYSRRTFCVEENNLQNLLNQHLVLLFVKLWNIKQKYVISKINVLTIKVNRNFSTSSVKIVTNLERIGPMHYDLITHMHWYG